MQETLVNFETAKLAKEKGFNLEVGSAYCEKGILRSGWTHCYHNNGVASLAPTQNLLQKWLREMHGIHIEILLSDERPYDKYYFRVMKIGRYFSLAHDGTYKDTYEETLEIGLQKGLKLV